MLLIAYGFFLPYFHRRLVKNDSRIAPWHIPLGPSLWKDDPWIPFPSKSKTAITDYYKSAYHHSSTTSAATSPTLNGSIPENDQPRKDSIVSREKGPDERGDRSIPPITKGPTGPYERFLVPTKHLPIWRPGRLWSYIKFGFLQSISREVVSFDDGHIQDTHDRAKRYDNRVEHLWTYAQVASVMIMSIAHGSNDVANAVGPWAASYATFNSGKINTKEATPTWMLAVAGLLLNLGFWVYGYHIIRSLGNKITQMSPTRGFSMELGSAINVLMASQLSLPVSTTQCLTGATGGVALMNYDAKAVNWRQLGYIFCGWCLTLPTAGLIAGLLMVMALNTPHFGLFP